MSNNTTSLTEFSAWYARYHGYISIIVCIIGVLCNLINIIVLTRPKLRNTTNLILTALALMDLLTMTCYIPFALHFYVLHGTQPSALRNSHDWLRFFLFHVNFTVTTHSCAIWLAVFLSVYRVIYIKHKMDKGYIHSQKTIITIILIIIFSCVIILIPNYMSLGIKETVNPVTNLTMYYELRSITSFGGSIKLINFWIHAVFIKLLPCLLLSIFGVLLIRTLRDSQKKRIILRRRSTISLNSKPSNHLKTGNHSRTTFMLLIVIILFLITELPQGILALCSGLMEGFFETYYVPLGDVMDITALLNNGINFILYCSMSKQFRKTFLDLFIPGVEFSWKCTRTLSMVTNGQIPAADQFDEQRKIEGEATIPLTARS